MWLFYLLKKHHAVFAQRDEKIFCVPFLKKRFADAPEIDIVRRDRIRIAPGNASCEKSFCAVRGNHRGAMPIH